METLVKWKEEYSVNIASIDDQHKSFVKIINELYDAFMRKEEEDALGDIVVELADYASLHFKTEEGYFAKTNYPEMAEHVMEHEYFIEQVKAFRNEIKMNTKATTPKIMFFLRDWLTHHITNIDKRYQSHLIGHGIQ
jgi:hemerythrin-like metal-binding protein